MGLVAFLRATRVFSLSLLSAMWKHSRKAATWKPGRQPSPELDHAGTLISNFQPPEMGENTFRLFRQQKQWHVVMAAQADQDTYPSVCHVSGGMARSHVSGDTGLLLSLLGLDEESYNVGISSRYPWESLQYIAQFFYFLFWQAVRRPSCCVILPDALAMSLGSKSHCGYKKALEAP